MRRDQVSVVARRWKQTSSVKITPLPLGVDMRWETLWGFLKELKDAGGKVADAVQKRKEQPTSSITARLRFGVLKAFEGRPCQLPPPATIYPAFGDVGEPWWPTRLPFTKQTVLEKHDLELRWSRQDDKRVWVEGARMPDHDAPEKASYSCTTWVGCKWRQHRRRPTSLLALVISERIDEVLAGLWLELEDSTKDGMRGADMAGIKLSRSPRKGMATDNYKKRLLKDVQAFLAAYPEAEC